MKNLILFLTILFLNFPTHAQSKQADKKEIERLLAKAEKQRYLDYKKKYLSKLGPRKGYRGNKDWDKFTEYAIKYEDQEIIKSMLKTEPVNQAMRANFQQDLFKIFREKPAYFIESAKIAFSGDLSCVVGLFHPTKSSIDRGQLERVKPKKLRGDMAKVFRGLEAKAYKGTNLAKCRKPLIK